MIANTFFLIQHIIFTQKNISRHIGKLLSVSVEKNLNATCRKIKITVKLTV